MRTTGRSQDFLGGDGAAEAIAPLMWGKYSPCVHVLANF